jgi:hypothetical protein
VARRPIIPVDYKFVAGRHFFTAATQFGQGLCVAHSNLKTAFDEVGRQLNVILSENHAFKLSDDVDEPGAFEQFQDVLNANSGGPEQKTIQIEWTCRILKQPTA